MNKRFDELNINNKINNIEIKFKEGKYFGPIVNGLPEGKGIFYFNNNNRYEGDIRNGKAEGNGIFYFNNGNR